MKPILVATILAFACTSSQAAAPACTNMYEHELPCGLAAPPPTLARAKPMRTYPIDRSSRHLQRQHLGHEGVGVKASHIHRPLEISLAGLPQPLVLKVREIEDRCPGFHVISAFRPGARIAGSGRPSLHASHKAADIAGPNYACAYNRLHGWPGGVSIDAARMRHIHMSWSPHGREWHARFNHWHGQRYARRSHTRRLAMNHRWR
jgi:hypothetical protein